MLRRSVRLGIPLLFFLVASLLACTGLLNASEKEKKYPLSLKVLNASSRPFTTHSSGGTQTNCNIYDSSANCSSYNTDMTWHHVENTMLVDVGDGKLYTISCIASLRWSKCVQLRAGDGYSARWEKHGLAILYSDSKGKQHEQTYSVVASAEAPSRAPVPPSSNGVTLVAQSARCSVTSEPSNADISLDGNFVGNTPSKISLSPGKHVITVSAKGFREWSREITVTADSDVTLNAALEVVK